MDDAAWPPDIACPLQKKCFRRRCCAGPRCAFELVEDGDRQGCPHCRGFLSYCLLHFKGCDDESNGLSALHLARSSAAANSKYGQFALGCHFQGDEHYAQAFAQFQLSEAQGLDAAQFELGRCYEFGYGIAKYDAEARRLYQHAADRGFPEAFEVLSELAADEKEDMCRFDCLVNCAVALHGYDEGNLNLAQKEKRAIQYSEEMSSCLFASNIPNISNLEITQRFFVVSWYGGVKRRHACWNKPSELQCDG